MTMLPESVTNSKEFKRKCKTARYTRENWERVLEVLRLGKSVQAAADVAGTSRNTVLAWRDRNDETRAEWFSAVDAGIDRMEDEMVRRAVDGVEKPVFGRVASEDGSSMEQIGTTTEYSDSLLQFALKGKRPKVYRESVTVSGDPDSPIIHGVKVVFVQGGAPGPQTIEHEEPEHE